MKIDGGTWGEGNATLTSITIGDKNVTGEKSYNNFDQISLHDEEKSLGIDTSGNLSGDWGNTTKSAWLFPEFGIDYDSADTTQNVDFAAPSINSASGTTTTATAKFAFKDVVYGVPWTSTVTQSNAKIVNTANNTQYGSYMTVSPVASSTSNDSAKATVGQTTITAHRLVDTVNPNKDDSNWTLTTDFKSGGKTVTGTADVQFLHKGNLCSVGEGITIKL